MIRLLPKNFLISSGMSSTLKLLKDVALLLFENRDLNWVSIGLYLPKYVIYAPSLTVSGKLFRE